MTQAERSEVLARRLVDLYNAGTAEWVEACHDPATTWHEMPTSVFPQGRSGGRDALRQAAQHAVDLIPDRRMTVRRLIAAGDQVALELDWVGTPSAVLGGSIRQGSRLRLLVAMFLTFANDRVVEQIDYPILCGPELPGQGLS